jgi:hypothetical protein
MLLLLLLLLVVLSSINFQCSSSSTSSSGLSLVLFCILSVFDCCRPLAVGKHLNKGIELL